jgi:hypothetical protein
MPTIASIIGAVLSVLSGLYILHRELVRGRMKRQGQ